MHLRHIKRERIKCPRNEGRREWPSEPDAPEKSKKIELD